MSPLWNFELDRSFGQWQRAGARVATGASLQCPVFKPQLASSADLTFVCECTRVRKVRDRAARTGGKGVIEMLNLKGYVSGRPWRASRCPRLKPSSKRSSHLYYYPLAPWPGPEFRAGVTQILFESFANLHPNFAKILPQDSLHGPETKAISFWVRNHWSSGTQISRNFLM